MSNFFVTLFGGNNKIVTFAKTIVLIHEIF